MLGPEEAWIRAWSVVRDWGDLTSWGGGGGLHTYGKEGGAWVT